MKQSSFYASKLFFQFNPTNYKIIDRFKIFQGQVQFNISPCTSLIQVHNVINHPKVHNSNKFSTFLQIFSTKCETKKFLKIFKYSQQHVKLGNISKKNFNNFQLV